MDDREFEEYLRRESQISQQYRELQDDAVPAHLDALVLEQARAALQKESAAAPRDDLAAVRRRRGRLMRWAVPTALAASALLVVSIVIRSGVQHETLLLPQVRQEAPGAAAQPESMEDKSVAAERAAAAPLVVPAAPPAAPAAARAEMEMARQVQQARIDSAGMQKRRAAAESSATAAAPAPRAQVDAIASLPAVAAPRPSVAEPKLAAEVSEPAPAGAPADVALAKAAPSPAQATGGEELDEIVLTGHRAASSVRGAGPRDTVRTNASGSTDAASDTTEAFREPEPWLEHIRQLRHDGEDRQADREWRRFRKQYPDYVVATDDPARADR